MALGTYTYYQLEVLGKIDYRIERCVDNEMARSAFCENLLIRQEMSARCPCQRVPVLSGLNSEKM